MQINGKIIGFRKGEKNSKPWARVSVCFPSEQYEGLETRDLFIHNPEIIKSLALEKTLTFDSYFRIKDGQYESWCCHFSLNK